MSLNMKRVEELEDCLSDLARLGPEDSLAAREQIALYLAGLEERLERLEKNLEE